MAKVVGRLHTGKIVTVQESFSQNGIIYHTVSTEVATITYSEFELKILSIDGVPYSRDAIVMPLFRKNAFSLPTNGSHKAGTLV